MSPSPAGTREVTEHRVSRIPSRPASRGVKSERVAASFSVSSTGSPIAATTSLPARRNVAAMTAFSRIPTAFRTPTSIPTYSGLRPRSFVSRGSAQSTRLRVPSSHATPTVEVRPSTAPSTSNATLSRNKPLPSPPIAQVIDPKSPPKAQRTLVDAEAGIPPANVWPILAPEGATSSLAALTTNVTAEQQQQPHRDSNRSNSEEFADTSVGHRTRPDLSDVIERPGTTAYDQETSEEHDRETIEQRHFSSNNPYAREFHAVSPQADVAVSSPLTRTSSPILLSIPPRVSSKRISLPLIGHLLAPSPIRAASSSSSPGQPTVTEWPLSDANTVVTTPVRPLTVQSEQRVNSQTSTPGLEADSNPSSTNGLMVELGSLHNPITGSSMRRIGKRPGHGPTLRVHGDAHAVLFGNPASFQRDSPEAKPRKTSFASSTARLSCKVSPRLGTTASSPVLISPIRAMRPARQASIRLPPLANASPSRPPPNNDGLVVVSAAANVEVGHNASSRGASVSAPRPLETSNSIQLDVNAPKQTPSFRLRAQRSVRSLFSRKENKPAESRPASVETAQSSIASAGRNLLKRISKNFSKEDLPAVPSVPEAELQNLEELNREQSAARAAYTPTTAPTRVPSPHPAPAPAPVAAPVSISVDTAAIHPETSRIITETVERAGTMPVGARETMLALEIGEAVIEVSELVSKANIAKERARQYAEEAQQHLGNLVQANNGLNRLMRLDFDDPILQDLKIQLQGSQFLADNAWIRRGGTGNS